MFVARSELTAAALAKGSRMEWRGFRSASDMPDFHRVASEVSGRSYQRRMLRAGIGYIHAYNPQAHRERCLPKT
jgi:hypothetical protein